MRSHSDELMTVAKRVVWFKSPDESLNDTKLFLAHLMTFGTLEDIAVAMRYYTDAEFKSVLTDPPAGVFDLRSWNYWNLRYHYEPVPPLPVRALPETDFTAT